MNSAHCSSAGWDIQHRDLQPTAEGPHSGSDRWFCKMISSPLSPPQAPHIFHVILSLTVGQKILGGLLPVRARSSPRPHSAADPFLLKHPFLLGIRSFTWALSSGMFFPFPLSKVCFSSWQSFMATLDKLGTSFFPTSISSLLFEVPTIYNYFIFLCFGLSLPLEAKLLQGEDHSGLFIFLSQHQCNAWHIIGTHKKTGERINQDWALPFIIYSSVDYTAVRYTLSSYTRAVTEGEAE